MRPTLRSVTLDPVRIASPLIRWWAYRDLLRNLVSKDLQIRYQGAVLGFAWSLMNPLMITLMYWIIFTKVFPSSIPNNALFLVTGILHWNLFSVLILQASELMVGNAALLKNLYFPRLLLPFSNLLVNLVLWSMALGIFGGFFPVLGGHWGRVLLLYPLYLLLLLGFSFGIMLTLSVLYVEFRDLKHLVEVMMQLLFWATPIVYPLSQVHSVWLVTVMRLSPLTDFTLSFQDLLWKGVVPSWSVTGSFLVWTGVSLGLGMTLFYRRGAQLIDRL